MVIAEWRLKFVDFSGKIKDTILYSYLGAIEQLFYDRYQELFAPICGGYCIGVSNTFSHKYIVNTTKLKKIPLYSTWDIYFKDMDTGNDLHFYIPCADYGLLTVNTNKLDLTKVESVNIITGQKENLQLILLKILRGSEGGELSFVSCTNIWTRSDDIPRTTVVNVNADAISGYEEINENGPDILYPPLGKLYSEVKIDVNVPNILSIQQIIFDKKEYFLDEIDPHFHLITQLEQVTVPPHSCLSMIFEESTLYYRVTTMISGDQTLSVVVPVYSRGPTMYVITEPSVAKTYDVSYGSLNDAYILENFNDGSVGSSSSYLRLLKRTFYFDFSNRIKKKN